MWQIRFTKQASKDKEKLKGVGLWNQTKKILVAMTTNPFVMPPSYEKLVGDLKGYYSRRINLQHRIVYRIIKEENIIVVHAMWGHYESL